MNFCCKCSTSSSLAPSSRSSRSSSISSLSDEQSSSSTHQLVVDQSENHLEELEDDNASLSSATGSSTSSSSTSSSSSSLHPDEDERFLEEDDILSKMPETCMSVDDYNRKIEIVKSLINLHVSKQSYSRETLTSTSSTLLTINNLWRQTQTVDGFNFNSEANNILTQALTNIRHGGERENSSLNLSDCSLDGDRVVIENSNLRANYNLSDWYLTREIENMPVCTYKLPCGSIVKSGKVLRVHTPFQSSPLEFLLAIKHRNRHTSNSSTSSNNKNKFSLKIITKLLSQDGSLKAVHTQEIPQFYQEIFKYASLIRLL